MTEEILKQKIIILLYNFIYKNVFHVIVGSVKFGLIRSLNRYQFFEQRVYKQRLAVSSIHIMHITGHVHGC